jgi:hypothetical protein
LLNITNGASTSCCQLIRRHSTHPPRRSLAAFCLAIGQKFPSLLLERARLILPYYWISLLLYDWSALLWGRIYKPSALMTSCLSRCIVFAENRCGVVLLFIVNYSSHCYYIYMKYLICLPIVVGLCSKILCIFFAAC